MKTSLQIDIKFEQIVSMAKQLPRQQKVKLTSELVRETTNTKLSRLLNSFKTKILKRVTIDVESGCQDIYEKQRR